MSRLFLCPSTVMLHVLLLAVVVFQVTRSQACQNNHPNCLRWVANGFCTSIFYPSSMKLGFCPLSCGLCSSCMDRHPRCSIWASTGFCQTGTFQQRSTFCASTCNLCSSSTTVSTGSTGSSDSTTSGSTGSIGSTGSTVSGSSSSSGTTATTRGGG